MIYQSRRHRRRSGPPVRNYHESFARNIDEVLELIWTLDEDGSHSLSELLNKIEEPWAQKVMDEMISTHLISISGDDIKLETEGYNRAKQIIRRHRLAERLLTEVLEVNEATMEASACKFEHSLNAEVTESICTLLGHPPTCPHGKPIPQGKCCQKYAHELKPLLVRLSALSPGQEATIAFISPRYHSRLDRLGSFGIIPGTKIHLHQTEPAPVIQVGGTDLALEKDIADEIYVRII